MTVCFQYVMICIEWIKGGGVKKRLFCFAVVLLICLCCFVGCAGRYHAELYSNAREWVDEDFLKEHRVWGAAYPNEDYVEGVSDPSEAHIWDDTSPKSHTVVISTQEDYRKIFPKSTVEVDFDEQLVIFYTFRNCVSRRHLLKKIEKEDQTLKVYYKLKFNWGRADTTMPGQRCFMLVMDQTDFKDVEFIEQ